MALFKIYRGDSGELPGGKNPTNPQDIRDGYAYFCTDSKEFFIDVDFGGSVGKQRLQINALAATKLSKENNDGSETVVEIDDIVLNTDIIDVKHGGTGQEALTVNAVLVGDGTNKVKLIPANLGAFYVDTENGQPKFGVLPVAQGGLGGTGTLENGGILRGNGTDAVSVVSGTGALYAATKGSPQFGILPTTLGGTGGNSDASARNNLKVYSKTEVDNKVSEEVGKATTVAYTHTIVTGSWRDNATEEGAYVSSWDQVNLQCGKNHDVPPEITFTSNRDEYNKIESAIAENGVGIKFYADKKPTKDIGIIIIDQM